ncbi:MAG: universal stress protein [Chitinophagaceae bacterium]|nr:universal stress protein [Sphingobacteriales bacterium]TSA42723.1 MAG: universal stress protein [Chitinophagaceae bacterium]
MTTVIVPVDFSETSLNAARYAAQLLVGHYGVTIVLYHSYAKPADKEEVETELNALKADLMKKFIVKVETLAHEEDDFVEGLERAARHRRADLVIMGIAGKSAIAQVLFGSNTLKMAETKVCPVLIVPEAASFLPIKNVMLTSDFKDTLNATPSVPIKNFLDLFHPKLHIVNVDKDHYISITENYEKEKHDLVKLFSSYHPEFYFMRLYDVDEALELFAADRDIDLIITIQRDHSFIERFFRTNRTKKLSFHSKMPILVIHE